MESTLHRPALAAAKTSPKARIRIYWIVTAIFCLQMSFTAYAELRLPQVAEAFTHLGFPGLCPNVPRSSLHVTLSAGKTGARVGTAHE